MTLDLPRTYRYTYVCSTPFRDYWNHDYQLVGAKGALNFHITDHRDFKSDCEPWSGGLEIHYRIPPEYMADQPPSYDVCHLLKCPCWHDGTSMYASDTLIPFWLGDRNDHERMFAFLAKEADKRLGDHPDTVRSWSAALEKQRVDEGVE